MKMLERIVRSFKVAKVFRENVDHINSIDFFHDGNSLVSSSNDDQIVIYDCQQGITARMVNTKKYGVDHINFTHSISNVIHSCSRTDDTIRYLSVHDNKYIRFFSGHTKKIVSLCISPIDDSFLSGSLDKTIRVWDLRSPNCTAILYTTGRPIATYDPEGLIFAVGIGSESVRLFDLRCIEKGPFLTFKYAQEKECDWIGIKFSADGKKILISTNGSIIRLIDAFDGTPQQTFSGFQNNRGTALEASFSPDSQFVFSGSADGHVHAWNADTGYKICVLNTGRSSSPIPSIKFNPKYMLLATGSETLAFWIPTLRDQNGDLKD